MLLEMSFRAGSGSKWLGWVRGVVNREGYRNLDCAYTVGVAAVSY